MTPRCFLWSTLLLRIVRVSRCNCSLNLTATRFPLLIKVPTLGISKLRFWPWKLCKEYLLKLFTQILDQTIESDLSCIFRHVSIWRNFYNVHFRDWNITVLAERAIGPEPHSELLMVEYGGFEVHSFDKVFLDEKDGGPGFFVSLGFVGDALNKSNGTLRTTYGGVRVKIPSLGMLTPLPMRRFLLM